MCGIKMDYESDPLRNAIDIILNNYQKQNEQLAALEELRSSKPHSISPANIERFFKLPDGEGQKYDCFTFALDLIDCQERIAVQHFAPRGFGSVKRPGIDDVLPGANFFNYLAPNCLSSMKSCQDFDLIVYYDKFGKAQHAGKIVAASILSKWGMKGYLWQHSIWEVPSSYGTSVKYYSKMNKEYVRKRWIEYLCELAKKVGGFINLVSVMHANYEKNLNHQELLELAVQRATDR